MSGRERSEMVEAEVTGSTQMNTKTLISFICVFVLMSSLSAGLDIKHVYKRLKSPLGIIIGLLCCYGFLPMLAFMLSLIFKLPSSQSIGLILMSTCPGGAFASVAVYLFNADLPLSIAMTTASTILSFIFIIINSTLYLPIIAMDSKLLNLNYNILFLSVSINLISIIIGLFISYFKYKKLQKLLGLAGLWIVILSTFYTLYNLSISYQIFKELSFGSIISPLIICIFSYIFGFGITFFFNLPPSQIVAIALQCGNPNVYLSICILYVTLQSAGNNQVELALSMPILFTIYGTFITVFIGIYLKKYKFITIKKHKKLKKFSKSILKRFSRSNLKESKKYKHNNNDILKSISSSSESNENDEENDDQNDPIQEIKEKCQKLFKEIPEAAMQPEKIMEYVHEIDDPYGDNDDNNDDDNDYNDNDENVMKNNSIKAFTINSDSDSSD